MITRADIQSRPAPPLGFGDCPRDLPTSTEPTVPHRSRQAIGRSHVGSQPTVGETQHLALVRFATVLGLGDPAGVGRRVVPRIAESPEHHPWLKRADRRVGHEPLKGRPPRIDFDVPVARLAVGPASRPHVHPSDIQRGLLADPGLPVMRRPSEEGVPIGASARDDTAMPPCGQAVRPFAAADAAKNDSAHPTRRGGRLPHVGQASELLAGGQNESCGHHHKCTIGPRLTRRHAWQ